MDDPSDALVKLNGRCTLSKLSLTELVARRADDYSDEQLTEGVQASPAFSLQTDLRDDHGGFSLGLRVQVDFSVGEVSASAVGEYQTEQALAVSDELVLEYANHVGVMTLIPFLRQAVADLTQRVFDAPLLMPIFARGELWFSETSSSRR